jgi:anaerobic magnesium-protoporphyrin IX monomethyl ester cyclase
VSEGIEAVTRYRKVVVANAPSPDGYVANKDSMGGFGQLFDEGSPIFPPLDLVYLASYLIERGVDVELVESLALDLSREGFLDHVARAVDGEPALLVVRTAAPTLDWDLQLCTELKARQPALAVAVYGNVVPHVLWRIQAEPSVDYAVKGEPDDTILELASGAPLEEIAGLTFRSNGSWGENSPRPLRKELDELPFPKWELLPYRRYTIPKSSTRHDLAFLPMLTSRGCPIGCHYCPYPVGQGLAWRKRSPENVVDEMERLVRDLGIEYVLLRDPMFSLNQKRVLAICDEIVRRGLRIEWKCETRVDFLKEETLQAMARAGCTGVNFGVESADVEIQKGVGRAPIEQAQFRETIRLCNELGIDTFAFFIIGLPGDTVGSILKTIKFAIDMRPTWVQFTAASPFIGTKLRDWALERGLTSPDKYAYVNSHGVQMGNGTLSEREIQALLRFAQFFQRKLINRGGVLKDHRAPGRGRRLATVLADRTSHLTAQALYSLGSRRLRRQIPLAA